MRDTRRVNPGLALEQTMRDVLGNMEEIALEAAYSGGDGGFELLSIEPAQVPDALAGLEGGFQIRPPLTAAVTPLEHKKSFQAA